ncbi:helicase/secretion neighborhood TadE-like protein [Modestobacter sp. DSM 44400]|nr:helicase/secretion neighborhood TadE-like protein [Modestobacter sp. DSM 44400]
MRPDDGERGSATVWMVALAGLLAAVGMAAVLVGAAVIGRHRAGTAADLAALAAAGRAVVGDPQACDVAGRVAAANGATVDSCTVAAGAVVEVRVRVPVRLGPLGVLDAPGRARAGPAPPKVTEGAGKPAADSEDQVVAQVIARAPGGPVVRPGGPPPDVGPVVPLGRAAPAARAVAAPAQRGPGSGFGCVVGG